IYAAGDLRLGGTLDATGKAAGQAALLSNESATIEVERNADIAAASIQNRNLHFASETVEVSREAKWFYRLDGTTDITRTMAIGEPSAEMRQRFTLVLKGNLALAGVRFPAGTTGSSLDALARAPLWMAGLDYDHGTGHGVGSYLGVHEGPQRISKAPNAVALQPGMIVSNEPGYYK
ncbi:M24 family metallopeptidase, partial [Acidovorax sp. ST3]|uniref:M24 family metallopeptidase n=1 Tax=Acidovorax sp. ST3 TaxID=2219062 RepID=UPI00193DFE3F